MSTFTDLTVAPTVLSSVALAEPIAVEAARRTAERLTVGPDLYVTVGTWSRNEAQVTIAGHGGTDVVHVGIIRDADTPTTLRAWAVRFDDPLDPGTTQTEVNVTGTAEHLPHVLAAAVTVLLATR